jgi:hypothetical protein
MKQAATWYPAYDLRSRIPPGTVIAVHDVSQLPHRAATALVVNSCSTGNDMVGLKLMEHLIVVGGQLQLMCLSDLVRCLRLNQP